MKRISVICLALAAALLLAACGAAPAASSPAASSPAASASGPAGAGYRPGDAVGLWQDTVSQRASLSVLPARDVDGYTFTIRWGSAYNEQAVWTMSAAFDEEAQQFVYADGRQVVLTYPDGGGAPAEDVQAEDLSGCFTVDGEGLMRWSDARVPQGADCAFEHLIVPAPSAGELAEGWFLPVAELQPGSAGASLKQAAAARDVLVFCRDSSLWTCDVPELRANLLAAWEGLTDEQRAAFDDNWLDEGSLSDLVNRAFEDWSAVEGLFADADAAEAGEIAELDVVRYGWELLFSHTLTMGNSDT